jgi:hypothetical protein
VGGLPAASGHELALPGQLLHQAGHHRLLPSLKETVSQFFKQYRKGPDLQKKLFHSYIINN